MDDLLSNILMERDYKIEINKLLKQLRSSIMDYSKLQNRYISLQEDHIKLQQEHIKLLELMKKFLEQE